VSQPTGFPGSGVRLSNSVLILCGQGSPNSSTSPDVQSAGPGSLFLRQDTVQMWICATGPTWTSGTLTTPSVWTQITIP
jgi:hypothetical protein